MDTGAFLHTVAGVEIFGRKISEYTAQEHSTWLVCFGREIPRCCRCGYFWLGNLRVYGTGVFNVGGFFWQGNPLIYGQVWYMYSIYCRKFPKMYRHLGVWSSKSSRPLFSGTCLCACMFIAWASACMFIACVPACVSPAQVLELHNEPRADACVCDEWRSLCGWSLQRLFLNPAMDDELRVICTCCVVGSSSLCG